VIEILFGTRHAKSARSLRMTFR